MRFFSVLAAIFLGISLSSFAQVTVSLGVYTGSGSTNVLLSTSTTSNRYSRTISLYTASEIITAGGMAGTISSLAWDKSGTGEYLTNDAYIKIFIKHLSNSTWPTSPVPDWTTEVVGATEVFTSSTFSIPAGTGWKSINFTTPFVWNGVDNIAIFVEWDRSSTPTAAINWGRSTNTNTNSYRVGSTSLSALVLFVGNSRPLVQLVITPGSVVPVTGLTVSTQGSVPAVINTHGDSLKMVATVLPAAANQAVTWSVISGTGSATISPTGMVTALTNGSVYAKAVSVQDSTKMDSLLIDISNQIILITAISVGTQGSVPAIIDQKSGTLQLEATISPANANQSVNWSVINETGTAVIDQAGLLSAITNGLVWAKAVSVQDAAMMDSLQVTITNQDIGIGESNGEFGLKVYPNPVVSGFLNVEIENEQDITEAKFEIVDFTGKILMAGTIDSRSFVVRVDELSSGIYILKLNLFKRSSLTKFVVE